MAGDATQSMATILGCDVAVVPFKYLGVPVGCNMARIDMWKEAVEKFKTKLSNWRAGVLSVGGRLTLIKSVLSNLPIYFMSIYKIPVAVENLFESIRNRFFIGGDLGDRKMTWVAWRKCLESKELGGLGVGSIFALSRALLFKRVWRFWNQPRDLWAQVVTSLYGVDGGIGRNMAGHDGSPWCAVLTAINHLRHRGIDLFGRCSRKLGDGTSTSFWGDVWCGDRNLKVDLVECMHLTWIRIVLWL